MGSLPPLPDLSIPTTKQTLIDPINLPNLFKSQQKYLNYFFQNLDLSQTLTFTQTLLNSKGTIFFTGIGKSGFVAQKISQTLVSLGIRSGFLSPVDALHGDIGILKDILVLFSKSGNTEELLRLVPCARAKGVYLISVTSLEGIALMGVCDLNVFFPLERELCPFDLAPVTSTSLMGARNLTRNEYAANHPAGRIGKSLIFKVKDVMKKQE